MGTNHPLPWLNLMVAEPFYLFHFLTFFSYFIVRSSATQALSSQFSDRLLHREIQAILAFLVLTVVKGFLMAVALIMDYHLALCYMVGFLVIFVLTQQPAYHELGNASQLTPLQLETLLTEGNTSRFWLVEFRALCSSRCIRTSRFMSDLSITYSNKNFSFGTVDLGHFPNAAEKFGISLGVSMGQLPTYILFDNAVEVSRFPEVDYEAKASTPTIRKNLLCRHFELDRRLIDYVSGR
ncbi:thioredoxin superfamily protein isoform X2 [Tasmannia lanceolata]|uniref:thioredoxin superfamily protein isoform X2 n=1 Tax=Tasmannia lanceolata TaxID=3420 RepID=UPI004064A120